MMWNASRKRLRLDMAVLMAAIPMRERPRERMLALGAEALTERELLALVLRNGTNGISALDLAAALLAEYGSLNPKFRGYG
jgi:DNA repair protein RadC